MNFVGIPALILPVVWYLRARGRIVVLTVHDVVPHRPILGAFLAPLERWSLRLLYRAVSNLVVLYSGAISELVTDFGVQEARITVIPQAPSQWSWIATVRPRIGRRSDSRCLGASARTRESTSPSRPSRTFAAEDVKSS